MAWVNWDDLLIYLFDWGLVEGLKCSDYWSGDLIDDGYFPSGTGDFEVPNRVKGEGFIAVRAVGGYINSPSNICGNLFSIHYEQENGEGCYKSMTLAETGVIKI